MDSDLSVDGSNVSFCSIFAFSYFVGFILNILAYKQNVAANQKINI